MPLSTILLVLPQQPKATIKMILVSENVALLMFGLLTLTDRGEWGRPGTVFAHRTCVDFAISCNLFNIALFREWLVKKTGTVYA